MSISGISSLLGVTQPRSGAAGAGARAGSGGAVQQQEALSNEQQQQVRELQKTDTQVRQHEQAHKTVGGPYAGAISLEYTTGPDGRRYATAGEVPIDASPVRNDPEATIAKMEVVKRAALAPPDPSPEDRAVAAKADAAKAQAQGELRDSGQDQSGTGQGGNGPDNGPNAEANPASPLLNRQAAAAYAAKVPAAPAGLLSVVA
jgi:hypothetical protein